MSLEECRQLQKVELHAHLNGSISLKTIQKLLDLEGANDMVPANFVLQQPTTMDEVFKMFPLIHALTRKPEALKIATEDVIREFEEDNVVYLELRTTPKSTEFMTKELYISVILEAIQKAKLDTRLILSIDRRQTIEEAQETVKLALEDKTGLIVGVELSGNPILDGVKFIPLLQTVKNAGLGVTIHLAELQENTSEILEFLNFQPHRIGHGTFLHANQEYIDLMDKYKIPLEICLTSNILCKTTPTIADSHLSFWRNRGVPVAISTDDKGLMNDCNLSQEFQKAAKNLQLSITDLEEICKTSMRISFRNKKIGVIPS